MIYPFEVIVRSLETSYDLEKCEDYIDGIIKKSWAVGEKRMVYPDWYTSTRQTGIRHTELVREMYRRYKAAGWLVRNASDIGLEFYAPPLLCSKNKNLGFWKTFWAHFKAKVRFLVDI